MNYGIKIFLICFMLIPLVSNSSDSVNYETMSFDKQANKGSDLALVKKIRDELVNDKYLSKNGKNIKVIVVEKEITIKGPVTSDGEKTRIINIVTKLSNNYSIRDQLEIARDTY